VGKEAGSSCYPFDVVVISCPVNKKTATNGGSFAGIKSYQLFLPKVTGFHGAQVPKLSFSVAAVGHHFKNSGTLYSLSKYRYHGCRHWRFVVSFRVGLKMIVTGTTRSSRTERGFVHTVQLGANCLPGTECQAWNEINAAITAE
jgi:hypothetical protein